MPQYLSINHSFPWKIRVLEVNYKKKSDDPLCFAVSLKEALKYGLSPLSRLRENPEVIKYEGFLQYHGKYASKEENTEDKERI